MTLLLRPVMQADSALIYSWQNEPSTRRYFRNPEGPSQEEHEAWYLKRLKDDPLSFWLAIDKNVHNPVGFVRLEREEKGLFVSIVVAPEMRGYGYGVLLLYALREKMPNDDLYAMIDKRNLASRKIFENAGYRQYDDDVLVNWRNGK